MVDGVSVVHIDAEDNLDLVRELDVRRTPTVFRVGARGSSGEKGGGTAAKGGRHRRDRGARVIATSFS